MDTFLYYSVNSYPIVALVFLLLRYFFSAVRNRTASFLNVLNLLLLLLLTADLINMILNYSWILRENSTRIYFLFYISLFLLTFRRYRVKIWLTLMVAVIIVLRPVFRMGYALVESYFDSKHEHFAFMTEGEKRSVWWLVIFTMAYFLVCWVFAGVGDRFVKKPC